MEEKRTIQIVQKIERRVTITRQTRAIMKCWECSATHGRVVTLDCGHHFCITCLEDLHTDWTEGCKQPCQACFRLTVPKKTLIRHLTSSTNGGLPPIRGKSGHRLLTSKSKLEAGETFSAGEFYTIIIMVITFSIDRLIALFHN